jgi:hypothetical protein
MKCAGISAVTLGLGLLLTGPVGAATPTLCRAEVLRSEELPYAPIGSWLLKATMRITYPHGPTVVSTFIKNTPWPMTVRRGDTFRFDCEHAQDAWLVSLKRTR